MTTGLVRVPDVSFVSWGRLPGRTFPNQPIPRLPIDLAVAVVSKSNTPAEMKRKLRESFDAGTRLVWFFYPKSRTARVFDAPGRGTKLIEGQSLDGGNVLPGFVLPLSQLFDQASRGPDA